MGRIPNSKLIFNKKTNVSPQTLLGTLSLSVRPNRLAFDGPEDQRPPEQKMETHQPPKPLNATAETRLDEQARVVAAMAGEGGDDATAARILQQINQTGNREAPDGSPVHERAFQLKPSVGAARMEKMLIELFTNLNEKLKVDPQFSGLLHPKRKFDLTTDLKLSHDGTIVPELTTISVLSTGKVIGKLSDFVSDPLAFRLTVLDNALLNYNLARVHAEMYDSRIQNNLPLTGQELADANNTVREQELYRRFIEKNTVLPHDEHETKGENTYSLGPISSKRLW